MEANANGNNAAGAGSENNNNNNNNNPAGAAGSENNNPAGTGSQNPTGNQNPAGNDETGKRFTQEELSAVAATEKKQGKQAILNLFGVKSEKEAKEQAEAFKKWQESQKDTEQKLKDSQTAQAEAIAKATAAENKLALMMAGVNKESLEDALAIAALKVTDDKDLTKVLEEMKKEPKYKGFFTTNGGSSGTGNPAGHQGTGSGGTENLGARLGKNHFSNAPKKSNFFSK